MDPVNIVFASAISALWLFVVWMVRTYHKDGRADRKRCEDANKALSEEIKAVRDQQTNQLASGLQAAAIALNGATMVQAQGNAESAATRLLLDRVARALERTTTPPAGNQIHG